MYYFTYRKTLKEIAHCYMEVPPICLVDKTST